MKVKCWLPLLALLFLGSAARSTEKKETLLGNAAHAFTLPDLKGKPVRLRDFKGEVVVLNFWAFWCDTWKDELPHLKALAEEQEEVGFRIVAVSVDGTRLREFLRRTGGNVPFPVLLDGGGKVSAAYHIAHVPTVILVDGKGKVRYIKFGYPGNHAVLAEIRKAMGEAKYPSE